MAMGAWSFRFERAPSEAELRARLRAEVGRRRASERNVELEWGDDGKRLVVLSPDPIALVYAAKVCFALGGVHTDLVGGADRPITLADWVGTPWVAHGWWASLRLLVGPTRLVED